MTQPGDPLYEADSERAKALTNDLLAPLADHDWDRVQPILQELAEIGDSALYAALYALGSIALPAALGPPPAGGMYGITDQRQDRAPVEQTEAIAHAARFLTAAGNQDAGTAAALFRVTCAPDYGVDAAQAFMGSLVDALMHLLMAAKADGERHRASHLN